MFEWLISSPHWTEDHKGILLAEENDTDKIIPEVTLSQLMERSSKFPVEFPIASVRCCKLRNITSEKVLERNINSAYPVIHEHALYLCSTFLLFQRKFGLKSDFYKNMSLIQFIDRLLSKRAVMFVGSMDHYMLISGTSGSRNWERVGTVSESPPLILEKCLSYEEIKLSALVSVSSYSYFINEGDRYNVGVYEKDRRKIEENGIIIGLIGPRFEKPRVMEYRDIVVSKEQNTACYGYGDSQGPTLQGEFMKFYESSSLTYEQFLSKVKLDADRYIDLGGGKYFDTQIYARRLALSIDTLLIEANDRAKKENKMAYIHVVGLGLGVWKIHSKQDELFMNTFAQRIELLGDSLKNISDIRFACISHNTAGQHIDGDVVNGIKLHMVNRNPQEKLTGDDEGKLLVVSYAWDGNALPGNEFWVGGLDDSGDPAAACSSQVAELHNWHINPKATAWNLRVATFKGLVTFREYQELHRNDC